MDDPVTFTWNGSVVKCNTAGPLGLVFSLTFDAGSEWAASLLTDYLRRRFEERVTAVRRKEYEAGWKDAKAHKRPKRTWFRSNLRDEAP